MKLGYELPILILPLSSIDKILCKMIDTFELIWRDIFILPSCHNPTPKEIDRHLTNHCNNLLENFCFFTVGFALVTDYQQNGTNTF